jgi:hypothetical protein
MHLFVLTITNQQQYLANKHARTQAIDQTGNKHNYC